MCIILYIYININNESVSWDLSVKQNVAVLYPANHYNICKLNK
jgi:hypothetical protein